MKNRKAMILTSAILIAVATFSVVAFGSTITCYTAMSKQHQHDQHGQSQKKGDVQTASVEINSKGFEPGEIKLKTGVPAKVTFVRTTDGTCAKELVIKDYGIERKLPLNERVIVEFTPRKGEFTFACGMDMLKGKMIVE